MRSLIVLIIFGTVLTFGITSYAQPPGQGQPTQDVNVVNTPTVEIGNPDPVSTTVENNDANPVPMYDVDNPALQPVHLTCQIFLNDSEHSSSGSCTDQTIPAGKRLIIENISSFAQFAPAASGQFPFVLLQLSSFTLDGENLYTRAYPISYEQRAEAISGDVYFFTNKYVKLYHSSGNIGYVITRIGGNSGSVNLAITISGHLINVN